MRRDYLHKVEHKVGSNDAFEPENDSKSFFLGVICISLFLILILMSLDTDKKIASVKSSVRFLNNSTKHLVALQSFEADYFTRVIDAELTAYTSSRDECGKWYDGWTAGMVRVEDMIDTPLGLAAVDKSVIPFGSLIYVPDYGIYLACDTGKKIKGKRIDLLMKTKKAAFTFGRRKIKILVMKKTI